MLRRSLALRNAGVGTDLARSLNNRGLLLVELGRREEALVTIDEAVHLLRNLAANNWDTFALELASALSNLSAALAGMGQCAPALEAASEATTLCRDLARMGASASVLPRVLSTLGLRLGDVGRYEEAVSVTREALDLYRATPRPSQSVDAPGIAGCLSNLGKALSYLGRPDEALVASRKRGAVRSRRDFGHLSVDFHRRREVAGDEQIAPVAADHQLEQVIDKFTGLVAFHKNSL